MAGAMALVTKSASPEVSARRSAASTTSARLASSRPKALMTARPEYASSTRPVRSPRAAWRAAASFRVRAVTSLVATLAMMPKTTNTPVSMRS